MFQFRYGESFLLKVCARIFFPVVMVLCASILSAQSSHNKVIEITAPSGHSISFGPREVLSVGVSEHSNFNQLLIFVDNSASAAFSELTGENIGHNITNTFCSVVPYCPSILSKVYGSSIPLAGLFAEEARRIDSVLNGQQTCDS